MKGLETVSVIIPTYNREKQVMRAIKSVQAQTVTPDEIIVVDDGSQDDTAEQIQSVFGDDIKFIQHKTNQGGAAARNTGIDVAEGDYIAFLDSDDIWLTNKIEKQLAVLENTSDIGVVYANHYRKYPFSSKVIQPTKEWNEGKVDSAAAHGWGASSNSLLLIKKDMLVEVNGFDESLPAFQDWDLVFRLAQNCKFLYVEEPLALRFELHGSQISTDIPAQQRAVDLIETKWKHFILNEYGEKAWESMLKKLLGHLFWQAGIKYGFDGDSIKSLSSMIKLVRLEQTISKQTAAGIVAALSGKTGYKIMTKSYYGIKGTPIGDIETIPNFNLNSN